MTFLCKREQQKYQQNFQFLRGKNDFVEMSKNLVKYRSEKNNFVGPSK